MSWLGQARTTVFAWLAASVRTSHNSAMLKRIFIIGLAVITLSITPARAAPNNPNVLDNDLQRLAEILGALHYLRAICGANEGQKWRNEMQALIDAEAQGAERKAKLTAGFNRGYRGFQQTYRTCTPAAGITIRRYLQEGAKISRDITARYAN